MMRIPAILSLLLSIGFAAPIWAESDSSDDQARTEQLSKELELSAQQLKDLKAIKAKYRDQTKTLRESADSAKRELVKGMQTPNRGQAHEAKLKAMFADVQSLKRDIHRLRFEMSLEIRKLLTDDQIAKFKDWHHKGSRGNGTKR